MDERLLLHEPPFRELQIIDHGRDESAASAPPGPVRRALQALLAWNEARIGRSILARLDPRLLEDAGLEAPEIIELTRGYDLPDWSWWRR